MSAITCVEDLRRLAVKRVPRMFYDYADAGSWTESTYRANESDFQAIKFRQHLFSRFGARNAAIELDNVAELAIERTSARELHSYLEVLFEFQEIEARST